MQSAAYGFFLRTGLGGGGCGRNRPRAAAGTGLSAIRAAGGPVGTGDCGTGYRDKGRVCTRQWAAVRWEKVGGSRPISRVLSWATIHLERASPRASSDLPGSLCGPQLPAEAGVLPYLVLLQAGFAVPSNVATDAVRSYRTVSPLPSAHCCAAWAVCFLLHFPWARAPQALPGASSCGARTFLCK